MKSKLIILLMCLSLPAFSQNKVLISGRGSALKNGDTVIVNLFRQNIFVFDQNLKESIKTCIKNYQFDFVLNDINKITNVEIQIGNNSQSDLGYYLIEPGQRLVLNFEDNDFSVTGVKAAFFSIQHQLQQFSKPIKIPHHQKELKDYFSKLDSVRQIQLNFLKIHSSQLSKTEYSFLNQELLESLTYKMTETTNDHSGKYIMNEGLKMFYTEYVRSSASRYNLPKYVSAEGIEFLFDRYRLDSCLMIDKPMNGQKFINYLTRNFDGDIRERLLVYFLYNSDNLTGDLRGSLIHFANEMQNPVLRKITLEFIDKSLDGSIAYDFALKDINGKIVKLSDFKGTLVVIDFWFTGCGACRVLAPIMKDVEDKLAGKNIKFLSIADDKNIDTWKKSVASGIYASATISNLNGGNPEGAKTINEYKVYGYPTILIVDKNGKIVHLKGDPSLDKGTGLMQQLESLL